MKTYVKYIKGLCMVLLFSLMVLPLMACTDIDGDLASEKDVLQKVKEEVPSEKYEYVKVEHFTDKSPKEDIYYFKSKDRELEFQVLSTLHSFGIDGATLGYDEYIYVKYAEAVHELYMDRVNQVFEELSVDKRGNYCYQSYDDLKDIAEKLVKADQIYKEELQYNSAEWIADNPVCTIWFAYQWIDENGQQDSFKTFSVSLDGTISYDEVYDWITYEHMKNLSENRISDNTIPEDQMSRVHKERLNYIYFGMTNVSEEAYEDANARNLTNNSRGNGNDFYASYYYYPLDTYLILINTGITDENYAPQLMEHYTKALGYDCEVKYGKGQISWEMNGSKWEIRAKQNSDHAITEFDFYKDGTPQHVKYFTSNDSGSHVNCTYLVGITVEDFAKIFDLKWQCEEDYDTLSFQKK